jgi:glycosyltransferase involved in cell wall biosynthesis
MHKGQKICVVVPAFNEEMQIGTVLDKLPAFIDIKIVVDDGSTDCTADIARSKGAIVVSHEKNKGVGSAFQSGLRKAIEMNVDIMVNIDADGQFNPRDIEKLINPIIEDGCDFVTASRFKNPDLYPKMTKAKFYGNQIMSFLITKITGQKFYDVSCGFRAYSRKGLHRINLFGEFTYTQETFLDLAFKHVSIAEVPIEVRGTREFGKSKVASNLLRYGYQTLKIILKSCRDYKPFSLFGVFALVYFLISLVTGTFFVAHYIVTGAFSPHKWAGFTSGFFLLLASLSLIVGFILDMFARMRMNQEEILFYLKENHFKNWNPQDLSKKIGIPDESVQ